MSKKNLNLRWVNYLAMTLLPILAGFGLYFFIRVSNQEDRLKDYYLRILATTSVNLEKTLATLWNNVETSGKRMYFETLQHIRGLDKREAPRTQRKPVTEAEEKPPENRQESETGAEEPPESPEESETEALKKQTNKQEPEIEVTARLAFKNGHSEIIFTVSQHEYEYFAELQTLLGFNLPDVGFDAALLVNSENKALAQVGPSHLRLTRLPQLWKRSSKGDPESLEITRSTQVCDVEIAGADYKLFLQPVRVSFPLADAEPNSETALLLAGLVKQSAFRQQAKSISPSLIFALLVLLVLTLFSIPFLKIRFMGNRESLNTHHVLILAGSAALGCSVLVFGVLYFFSRLKLDTDQQVQLEHVSDEIHGSLHAELAAMRHQLRKIEEMKSIFAFCVSPLPEIGRETLLWFPEPLASYPFFKMVFWMDAHGWQTRKLNVDDWTTPPIRLQGRDYFLRARHNELWSTDKGEGFYLEPIISLTTGKAMAVLSMRVSGRDRVAAISSEIQSLIRPALPPGFGFCVLDQNGLVLFHSNHNRNLREVFFDEIHPSDALRVAVAAGQERFLEGKYHAKDLRYLVTPLLMTARDNERWNLVVFAEKSPLWAALTEATETTLSLLGLYLTVCILICIGLHFAKPRYNTPGKPFFKWYWPNPAMWEAYLRIIGVFLGITGCWVAFMVLGDKIKTAMLAAALGVTALIFVRHRLASSGNWRQGLLEAGVSPPWKSFSRVWMIVFILILVSPAIFLFVQPGFIGYLAAFVVSALVLVFLCRRLTLVFWMWITVLLWMAAMLCYSQGILSAWMSLPLAAAALMAPLLGWWPWRPKSRGYRALQKWAGRTRNWLLLYRLAALMFLVVISMLPSISFYRLAFDESLVLLQKHRQLEFMVSLRERAQHLSDRYKDVALNETHTEIMLEGLFPRDRVRGYPQPGGRSMANPNQGWGIHGRLLFGIKEFKTSAQVEEPKAAHLSDKISVWDGLSLLKSFFPGFSAITQKLRAMIHDSAVEIVWEAKNQVLRMEADGYRSVVALGKGQLESDHKAGKMSLELVSRLPQFSPVWGLVALLAGMVIFWSVIKLFLAQTFLTDFHPPRVLDGKEIYPHDAYFPKHRLILRPRPLITAGEDTHEIDNERIRRAKLEELVTEAKKAPQEKLLLPSFHEGLKDPAFAQKKLELLEALLHLENKSMVIQADIDPLYYFTANARDHLRDAGLAKKESLDLLVSRWATALEKFVKEREAHAVCLKTGADFPEEACEEAFLAELKASAAGQEIRWKEPMGRRLRKLARECWMDPFLRATAKSLARHPHFHELSPRQVVEQVGDLAEAHYRDRWEACSTEEKILLFSIARDGFVNARTMQTLLRLMRRGLVRATPNFHLMNRSFTQFCLHAELPEVLNIWVKQAGEGLWSRLRIPLAVTIVGLLVFMFTTQPDTFFQIVGIATALVTGAPALIKLLTLMLKPAGNAKS